MARALVKDRAAENDLIEIWIYSYERWGEEQADRYLSLIERTLLRLAEDPSSGRMREALRTGYWSVSVERHVVFYTFTESELRIRRVLHRVMDFERHLD